MNLQIQKSKVKSQKSKVKITGSKSETNRLLLLQALYPNLILDNTSNSDDSEVMLKALKDFQLPTSNLSTFTTPEQPCDFLPHFSQFKKEEKLF